MTKKSLTQKFEFKDVKYMTAAEKMALLGEWVLFLDSRCSREKFTKSLYQHFNLHWNHIAHYNIDGFYETWFSDESLRREFMDKFECEFAGGRLDYGANGANSDYHDINQAMLDNLKVRKPGLYAMDGDQYYEKCLATLERSIADHRARGPEGIKALVKRLGISIKT